MQARLDNPLIIQADRSVLLECHGPRYEAARDTLACFAELIKCPEHIHTYAISPLSLWNAAATGWTAEAVIEGLKEYSKYPIPENILYEIKEWIGRYGRLRLVHGTEGLELCSEDKALIAQIAGLNKFREFLIGKIDGNRLLVREGMRGRIKQALIKEIQFPVEDLAGYSEGESLEIRLRERALSGKPFGLRAYQRDAVDVFWAGGGSRGGSGVVVLPCGAGKTVVGMGAMEKVRQTTLILTTNITALRQWRDELLDKTTLSEEQIGEYSGAEKTICPVTLTTYQILTYRKSRDGEFVHLDLFQKRNWGLVIYDEVHLLPAPVFRAVADLQAKRRLGLTATLVREDGKEEDVFSLIGPKKHDVPWKDLERQGWIAQAQCTEICVPLSSEEKMRYAMAGPKAKFRIASENPNKMQVLERLIERHCDDNVLIIGQYISQLHQIADRFDAPIITGKTPNDDRRKLYDDFKSGAIKRLIVSKVANFAVDLPDANVAIQISGTFGSRQEEAQRLGRILRPKSNGASAHFYSIVSRESKDQEFARKRQAFLTEQGYRYSIENENAAEEAEGEAQDAARASRSASE
ncbi:MAG: Type III restriction enzyme, res subunit [candidate division BRC1 bacterium ADurb.BinA364]|nr:MAG: Type III restriction enzyme, res subunit [candidate division BRC1 bacterium ADurb.BinA364]